ncbi:hypothetical protein N7530_005667 [Penicillium desertorum]|uniref:Short-chain dehydrogenase n=1 Tax=Penicillium desertorum TaxID=1303715 RepID=A0A9X0BRQ8_9EURO|nr:hypothetical protein N7530_005667 [Penicillium desertorum]
MAPYGAETTATQLVNDYADLIKDQVVLATGISPGSLGGYFVQAIAKAGPSCLILAARNPDKAQQTANEVSAAQPNVKTSILQLDLGLFKNIRQAAAEVNSWDDVPVIDVLVNNAGIMAPEYKVTDDGFESQLVTNHLGPFLFTNLIMKKILASKSPRVVMVSSDGHRLNPFRFDDYNFDSYNKWYAYGQSKTANMLMSISLAEKLGIKHNLLAFSLHPGVIWTNIANHLDMETDFDGLRDADKALGNREGWGELQVKTPDQGVATHVYAAFDPGLNAHNGAYLIDCRIGNPLADTIKSWATSSLEAKRLWHLSEKLVGQEFVY